MISKFAVSLKPDILVTIGNDSIACNFAALQCYSDYFFKIPQRTKAIDLPPEYVTFDAFKQIYEWVLDDNPRLSIEGIISLFAAAEFLHMQTLKNQCWCVFDNDESCSDVNAFLLYLDAKKCMQFQGLELLKLLFLRRVNKFFLPLMASAEFVDLDVNEVCVILSSNMIGVHSELEVFMAGVHWLFSKDEKRVEKYDKKVILCTRFNALPLWFLLSLRIGTDCQKINRITRDKEIKALINDGITYQTLLFNFGEGEHRFIQQIRDLQLQIPFKRRWITETKFNLYKEFETEMRKNVKFGVFAKYVGSIQKCAKDFWEAIEFKDGKFDEISKSRNS